MADSNWFRMISNSRHRTAPKISEHEIKSCASTDQFTLSEASFRSTSDQGHHRHRVQLQAKTLSRLPSWQSLTHGHDHGCASTTGISVVGEDTRVINEEDRTWEKPSVDQMADTLLSVLMVKPTRDPLGPEYCSLALHVLEAYRESSLKIAELEKGLAQEKERRQRQRDDYEGLVSDLMNQATTYKAEIKRLELIIARDSGTAAVQVARSESLVDRRSGHRTSRPSIGDTSTGTVGRISNRGAETTRGFPLHQRPFSYVDSTATTDRQDNEPKISGSTQRHERGSSSEARRVPYRVGDLAADDGVPNLEYGTAERDVGDTNVRPLGSNARAADDKVEGEDVSSSSSSDEEEEESEYLAQNLYLRPRSRVRGGAALSAASSASTVRIHRRDFSFDVGDDRARDSSDTSDGSG